MKLWPFSSAEKIQHITDFDCLAHVGKAAQYTPDILEIEKKVRINVFVHDDMMKGGKLHEYLAETGLKGKYPLYTAYTVDRFYHWKKELGDESYSVALQDPVTGFHPDRESIIPARIEGEVYSIRAAQVVKLDFLRENGLQFFRKKVLIQVPHSKVIYSRERPIPEIVSPKDQFEAYMYIGNGYYWDQQLAGVIPSSPIPFLKHRRDDIGIFTKFENNK